MRGDSGRFQSTVGYEASRSRSKCYTPGSVRMMETYISFVIENIYDYAKATSGGEENMVAIGDVVYNAKGGPREVERGFQALGPGERQNIRGHRLHRRGRPLGISTRCWYLFWLLLNETICC